MKFIARHDRFLFSLIFLVMMIGHIFNTERAFVNFHISNSIGAITLLLIAWSVVTEQKLSKQKWLIVVALFISIFELVGFVAIAREDYFLIADTPLWIILTSVVPCLFNIILLGIIGWNTDER